VLINITKQIKILFYLYKAMKLTKGKLSKIQNKKKQSLKRFKKVGKTRKSKTFRKRKHVNLHNASLKKYKGGQTEPIEAKPVTNELETTQTYPITQTSLTPSSEQAAQTTLEEQEPLLEEGQQNLEEVNPTLEEEGQQNLEEVKSTLEEGQQNLEEVNPTLEEEGQQNLEEVKPTLEEEGPTIGEEVKPTLEEDGEQNLEEVNPTLEEDGGQNLEEPLVDSTTSEEPISSDTIEGSGSDQELPPPISEEGSSESEIETNSLDNAVGSDDNVSSEESPKFDAEPVSVDATPVENTPPIVVESLENLLDYISTKIAKKLKQQSSSFGNETESGLNRDSFNSVANANETLAES
jgi:hypothetical protein